MEQKDVELVEAIPFPWIIVPIVFGIPGGITAYLATHDRDPEQARVMLETGTGISFLWLFFIVVWYFF
ncbi:hypothetical protein ANME2D_02316 [Candidatus Methanoperedens nitroreducens]|uniref:Uncharacterized protein n=1 Tax=Candidatus Methanoperedens nitratireducens TaxID=1392998 RepID=A0A062UX62_9EURY|nr:hypothetical protein [Candidatus Methanoperedens nitroreducens]KCZ71581.1 hypothetical protein ANME2D_02316 [Candidatus Methanoperedens nitroreducens]MDJ1421209.1 hypothetical protein [Candidatus Methanoperedens sp.]